MLSILDSLKGLFHVSSVSIDNFVFKLHYKATVIILVAFSILVSCSQYLGDPIKCHSTKDIAILDDFCWVHSTYTVSKLLTANPNAVAYAGVGHGIKGEDEFTYHTYYQWMVFFLFFEALLFYVPRYIWKACEEGKVKSLTSGLNTVTYEDSGKHTGLKKLVHYFEDNMHSFRKYSYHYVGCEILNFFIVVINILLMDAFLGGEFSTYGIDVLHFLNTKPEDRADPMTKVFPTMTICEFHDYGTSGGKQDAFPMCLLTINILNEKLVVFLWFWFIFMAIVSGCNIVIRVATMASSKFRYHLLLRRSRISGRFTLDYLNSRLDFGDWFMISLIGKNTNALLYKDLLEHLCKESPLNRNSVELKSVECSD